MTRKDTFFDRPAFCNILSYMELLGEEVTLPMPTIFKPMELWTGKQVRRKRPPIRSILTSTQWLLPAL